LSDEAVATTTTTTTTTTVQVQAAGGCVYVRARGVLVGAPPVTVRRAQDNTPPLVRDARLSRSRKSEKSRIGKLGTFAISSGAGEVDVRP